jgi:uncharacterized protein (DUF2235 family)
MNNYESGDKLFLFGFSRGAYTVRVLAGFLHWFGLLPKGNDQLIPKAFELYSSSEDFGLMRVSGGRMNARLIDIDFLGVWDTVSSVGWVDNFISFPSTNSLANCKVIRQALAIDEKRCMFEAKQVYDFKDVDVKNVWFAGHHSDVGGGNFSPTESSLANVSLDWMLGEASQNGLRIKEVDYKKYFLGSKGVKPDPNGKMLNSMTSVWKIVEWLPKKERVEKEGESYDLDYYLTRIPRAQDRFIPEEALFHESVIKRLDYIDKGLPNGREVKTIPANQIIKNRKIKFSA